MIRGGHGYDPGYSRVSSGGGQSHADDDDDDDLITDGTMHGAVSWAEYSHHWLIEVAGN